RREVAATRTRLPAESVPCREALQGTAGRYVHSLKLDACPIQPVFSSKSVSFVRRHLSPNKVSLISQIVNANCLGVVPTLTIGYAEAHFAIQGGCHVRNKNVHFNCFVARRL